MGTFLHVDGLSKRRDSLEVLSQLARAEREGLTHAARSEGVSAEDAVECVQDALCTLLSQDQRGELSADTSQWKYSLVVMVKNAARNRRRRHDHALVHDENGLEKQADSAPQVDDVLARAESHVRLRACIAELCEVQRAVVMLRLLDERPGEDVAHALGISRGHVDVLAHRARAALKTCMTRGEQAGLARP